MYEVATWILRVEEKNEIGSRVVGMEKKKSYLGKVKQEVE